MKKLESVSQSYWKSEGSEKTYKRFTELIKYHNSEVESVEKVLKSYEDSIRMKDSKIRELEERVEQLQSSLTLYLTDDDLLKEIIKMYSKGNSALVIHKNLTEFKKVNIEYEVITDTLFKLDNEDLPIHLMDYYNECIKTLLANPVSEVEKIKIEELRRLKSHQEKSDAILNDINKRLATCSNEEVKELTELTMKVMESQRRTSESMSKWDKNGNGNNSNQVSEVIHKDTDKFEKQAVQAFLNFDGAEVEIKEVV